MPNLLQVLTCKMQLQNYSPKTIRTYCSVAKDLYHHTRKPLNILTHAEIEQYLYTKLQSGCSSQTIRVYIQAIHFILYTLYNRTDIKKFCYPKRPSRLPNILSKKEIHQLLQCISNPKHHLLIALSYSAGLRVSEAVNLHTQDIDLTQHLIHIRNGKGNKDRLTIFSTKLSPHLQQLTQYKQPHHYLFESERGGKLTEERLNKYSIMPSKNLALLKKLLSIHSGIALLLIYSKTE